MATPATAGTSSYQVHCIPAAISSIPPFDGQANVTITADNTTPAVGQAVTLTIVLNTPLVNNSPFNIAIPADQITPTLNVTLGGAQTGTLALTGPKANPAIPAGANFPILTWTSTFTPTASGAITITPGDFVIHSDYLAPTDNVCTVITPPAPVAETVTVTAANARQIGLSSTSGVIGATVTVTGSGFTPNTLVTVIGLKGADATGEYTSVTTNASGALNAPFAVSDLATTAVVAFEGTTYNPDTAAQAKPYTVIDNTPPPAGSQRLNSTVAAGTLSMTQAGDTVNLSTVDFGSGSPSTGKLNLVTVKDFRSGTTGWTLTGSMANFSGPNGNTIGGDQLSWTPTCGTKAGSPSTCVPGTPGSVGNGATLASTPDAALTGGTFDVGADLTLKVPEFAAAGTYSGLLTLTLA
jgi:hypothetical protein